jgi:ABC-type bacteriocin/lantibiotic exporter with double-glycine peptidase domain
LGPDHETDLWGPLAVDAETGTEPERIAAVARRYGIQGAVFLNMTLEDLRQHLNEGTTVILCLQAWRQRAVPWALDWDDGHYVVLVGIDSERAYFMDPSTPTAYTWVALTELQERWHNPDPNGNPQRGLGVVLQGERPLLNMFPELPKPLP